MSGVHAGRPGSVSWIFLDTTTKFLDGTSWTENRYLTAAYHQRVLQSPHTNTALSAILVVAYQVRRKLIILACLFTLKSPLKRGRMLLAVEPQSFR